MNQLNEAEEIFKNEKVDIQGSGRTDAGVHALMQIAHLDVKTVLAPEIIRMKFNDNLPNDINILEIEKTHPKFHARHDAVSRTYIYQISKRRTAFGKQYVWWIKDKLNFSAMEKASKLFLGMKDFASFSDDDPTEKSTKVLLENIELIEKDEMILIRIQGSHFLWKMVRRIVGVLVEIGRGNLTEKNIQRYFQQKTKESAKFTAPPSGLFLEQIIYKEDKLKEKITPLLNLTHLKRKTK